MHLEASIGRSVFKKGTHNLDRTTCLRELYSIALQIQNDLLQSVSISANQIVVFSKTVKLGAQVELVEISLALLKLYHLVYNQFNVNIAAVLTKLI